MLKEVDCVPETADRTPIERTVSWNDVVLWKSRVNTSNLMCTELPFMVVGLILREKRPPFASVAKRTDGVRVRRKR